MGVVAQIENAFYEVRRRPRLGARDAAVVASPLPLAVRRTPPAASHRRTPRMALSGRVFLLWADRTWRRRPLGAASAALPVPAANAAFAGQRFAMREARAHSPAVAGLRLAGDFVGDHYQDRYDLAMQLYVKQLD